MISERLGLVLRQLRLDRQWSQQEMADRSRVLRGYLSRVECGKTIPGWENMERFALILGVSVAGIIQLAEAPVEVKMVEGAGPVLVESSPQPDRDRGIRSSRSGSLDNPLLATIESVDDQHLVQRDQHGKLHRVPLSSVQWGIGSRGSNGGEVAGIDTSPVSGDGRPTLIEAAVQPGSRDVEGEPISEPE